MQVVSYALLVCSFTKERTESAATATYAEGDIYALRADLCSSDIESSGMSIITDCLLCDILVRDLSKTWSSRQSSEDMRGIQARLLRARKAPFLPKEAENWIAATSAFCSLRLAIANDSRLEQHQMRRILHHRASKLAPRSVEGFFLRSLFTEQLKETIQTADVATSVKSGCPKPKASLINLSGERDGDSPKQLPEGLSSPSTNMAEKNLDVDLAIVEGDNKDTNKPDKETEINVRLQAVQMLLHDDSNVNIRYEAITGASRLQISIERVKEACSEQAFYWNDASHSIEINDSVYETQVEVLSDVLDIYPTAEEELPLVRILFGINRMAGLFQSKPSSQELGPRLQHFLKLCDVSPLDTKLRKTIEETTELFKKADMMLRVTEFIASSFRLFKELCYDASAWDRLHDGYSGALVAFSAEDNSFAEHMRAGLQCASAAQKFCHALKHKSEERCELPREVVAEHHLLWQPAGTMHIGVSFPSYRKMISLLVRLYATGWITLLA